MMLTLKVITRATPTAFVLAIVLSTSAPAELHRKDSWSEFVSHAGFRISYPSIWFKLDRRDKERLAIISTRKRLDAVVIPEGGQMISARRIDDYAPDFPTADSEDEVLRRYTLAFPHSDPRAQCTKARVVESTDEVGPRSFYLEHHMYCRLGPKTFVIVLTEWKADGLNKTAYSIAVKMLKSLRVIDSTTVR